MLYLGLRKTLRLFLMKSIIHTIYKRKSLRHDPVMFCDINEIRKLKSVKW